MVPPLLQGFNIKLWLSAKVLGDKLTLNPFLKSLTTNTPSGESI
jgi:hypothetical protein